jgi:hypothetical protein
VYVNGIKAFLQKLKVNVLEFTGGGSREVKACDFQEPYALRKGKDLRLHRLVSFGQASDFSFIWLQNNVFQNFEQSFYDVLVGSFVALVVVFGFECVKLFFELVLLILRVQFEHWLVDNRLFVFHRLILRNLLCARVNLHLNICFFCHRLLHLIRRI